MLSKYNRNGIITAPLDSYCLICDCYLKSDSEIAAHIEKQIHVKTLDSTPYLEKYKDDHVRKIKLGYYCEFCNLLLSTAPKVELHLTDAKHNNNKGFKLLRRTTGGVVAFQNILISDKAWNTIHNGTCSLCGVEFESESIHKCSTDHVINLIKNHVEFVGKSVYRKIDEETFQCLTCDELFALNTLTTHVKDPDHNVRYQKCHDLGIEHFSEAESNNTDEQKTKSPHTPKSNVKVNTKVEKKAAKSSTEKTKETNNLNNHKVNRVEDLTTDPKATKDHSKTNSQLPVSANRSKILDSVTEFQQNDIAIKFESSTAVCKKCTTVIAFDYDAINSHVQKHKKNQKNKVLNQTPVEFTACDNKVKTDGKSQTLYTKPVHLKGNETADNTENPGSSAVKDDENIAQLARKYNLNYNNGKVYCPVCKTHLPSSIKNIIEHVDGAKHKSSLKSKHIDTVATSKLKEASKLKKVPLFDFIESGVAVEGIYWHDFVINEKLCLNILSFLAVRVQNGVPNCLLCNVAINQAKIDDHTHTNDHKNAMEESVVIASLDSEFVREIHPDVFHCGFCNCLQTGWDAMETHLASGQHRQSKISAEFRLQLHLPAVRQHHVKKRMEIRNMLALMHLFSSRRGDSDNEDLLF